MIDRSQQSSYWLSFIFISTYFFYRTHAPLPDLSFYLFTLPFELVAICLMLTVRVINRSTREESLGFIFFTVFILSAITFHSLFLSTYFNDGNVYQQLINIIRLGIYIVATVVFARFFFKFDVFYNLLFRFSLISSLFVLAAYFVNPYFMSDVGYGMPRPKGLLSEPSAFGPILAFLFFASLHKRHYLGLLASTALIAIISSGTVIVVFVITSLFYLLKASRKTKFIFLFFLIGSAAAGSSQINTIMNNSGTLLRLSNAITETNIQSGEGGTARLITFFNLYNQVAKDERYWSGRGFNSAKVFFGNKWEFREFGLLHFYLFSFGITGLLVFLIFVSYVSIQMLRKTQIEVLILFIPFICASIINSAQGTVLHKFAYLGICVYFFQLAKNKNTREISNSRLHG